jgi:hypothetical protein
VEDSETDETRNEYQYQSKCELCYVHSWLALFLPNSVRIGQLTQSLTSCQPEASRGVSPKKDSRCEPQLC